MALPKQVILIPLLKEMAFLKLHNTLWAVILPTVSWPFGVFLMKQFCEGIPNEMLEAARIGGDEFAVILQKSDYEHRDELLTRFDEACAESRSREADVWNQVNVARGVATYDPAIDGTVNDVVRRADQLMYENKWQMKNGGTKNG